MTDDCACQVLVKNDLRDIVTALDLRFCCLLFVPPLNPSSFISTHHLRFIHVLIADSILCSKATFNRIRMNFVWALGYNIIGSTLAFVLLFVCRFVPLQTAEPLSSSI